MDDLRTVGLAPGLVGEGVSVGSQFGMHGIDGLEEEGIPRLVARVEEVQGPGVDDGPDGAFGAAELGVVERRILLLDGGRDEGQHAADDISAEHADQAIGGRVGRCPAGPCALDKIAHLASRGGTVGRLCGRRGIEDAQGEGAPALEEQGAVVELQRQHVARACRGAGEQIVADDAGADAIGIATVADAREPVAVDHRGVGGPDAPDLRVDDAGDGRGVEVAVPAPGTVGP